MPDLAVPALFIVIGWGLGLASAAPMVGWLAWRLWAAELTAAEYRITERALGMVRDITQVRAATPPSLTPHLDAIAAEKAAWELGRQKQLAAESDKRFNADMGGGK